MIPQRVEMKPEEFRLIQEYVEQAAGVFLDEYRSSYLALRLSPRLEELRLPTFSEYYGYLKFDPRGYREHEQLMSLITNHETYFFREMAQLKAFADKVLPELKAYKRSRGERKFRIVSAGCSTGEEVYSLAMLAADNGLATGGWETTIYGIDIDQAVVAKANRGCYGERAVHATPEEYISRHFRIGAEGYEVREHIRKMCRFMCGNILRLADQVEGPVDCIFCRNVLIYFRDPMVKVVANQFSSLLDHNGFLFLGHSETLTRITRDYNPVLFPGAIAYRKRT